MSVDLLTLDNPPLSTPTNGSLAHFSAINCKQGLSVQIVNLIRESLSTATRRAYRSDLIHFENAGGSVPSTAEALAQYLASQSEYCSIATLQRRLAAIAKAHLSQGFDSPTTSELVKATLRGLRRTKGISQRQAIPLLKADLILALSATNSSKTDARDRALLLLGFAGGFRRSELVGLNCNDLSRVRQGLEVTIRRSKTDQEGAGRKIGIPLGRSTWCAVAAVEEWLKVAEISDGCVFRPIDRHGRISGRRLSGAAVCSIIRTRLDAAGIEPAGYSGHSLRSGLATSAAQAGVSFWKIRQQTGHTSDAMLSRYVRDAELFIDNAAGALF